jgi:hypothetical protein
VFFDERILSMSIFLSIPQNLSTSLGYSLFREYLASLNSRESNKLVLICSIGTL